MRNYSSSISAAYLRAVTPLAGDNTLTAVVPQLLAQGLMALRQNAIMPLLVNRDYEDIAKEKGNSVDIPIPSAVTSVAVSPGPTPPANADQSPTSVNVALDQWYEAPFYLTDKEMREVMNDHIPMTASEAIKSLVNRVDSYIINTFYPGVYGYVGTAGVTPFTTDVSDATQARAKLMTQLAPQQDLRFVMDPAAEAKALELRAFHDMSFSGQAMGILQGQVGTKFGFNFAMDQNLGSHTTTAAGTVLVDQADVDIGDTTVHFDGLTTAAAAGDIFTVSGDSQTYVVTSASVLAGTDGDMTFAPAAAVAWANDAEVTFKASHAINLAFHRDAYAFASRPLADQDFTGGSIIQSATDPISGLSLRLEVSRQHKQTRWSFDMLYGGKLVRPELGVRIAG